MKMACCILLIPALFPQDHLSREVGKLIEKLSSESVEERADATRGLLDLGDRALSDLEQGAEARDAEARARIRAIIVEIQLRKRAKLALREPRLVSLNLASTTAEEAARTLLQPFGLEPRLDVRGADLGNSAASIEVKEAPLWDAFDIYCDRFGVAMDSPLIDKAVVRLVPGVFAPRNMRWTTLGNARIVVRPVGLAGTGGNVAFDLHVLHPRGELSYSLAVDELRVEGGPLHLERPPWNDVRGVLTKDLLKGAKIVTLEGRLVMTLKKDGAQERAMLPFSIKDIPIPKFSE